MYTRADYMNRLCTHHAYYAQLVTPAVKAAVNQHLGPKLADSEWPFNTIPLAEWDKLTTYVPNHKFLEYGDTPSLAGAVCVLKAAAVQLKEKT